MADDARISTALPHHPKTVKLERRLGAQGCWSLIKLFLWVAENRPIGDLAGMSGEDIGIAAEWPGDTGELVRTLAEVRFLDGEEGSYKIHDWAEHNPWAANRPGRVEKARAAAGARWERKRAVSEPEPNAVSMPGACSEHDLAMPTSPHLTSPPDTTEKSKACAVAPVDWIPADSWAGFLEMRKKMRRPPTDRAVALIVKQLERLRDDGHDPGAVLDQSTRNNWQDVFPLKGTNGYGNGSENRAERRKSENIAAGEGAVDILHQRRMAS
jgi:hypothetical protein